MKQLVPSPAFLDFVAKHLPAGQLLEESARLLLSGGKGWNQHRPTTGGMLRMWSVACPAGTAMVRIAILNVSAHQGDLITIPSHLLPRQEQIMEVVGQGELHVFQGAHHLSTHRHDLQREFRFVPGYTLRAEHGVVLAFEL